MYHSPSQGKLEFGWEGPLRQNGRAIPLHNYLRYDNKYAKGGFPGDVIEVGYGRHGLLPDYSKQEREVMHAMKNQLF